MTVCLAYPVPPMRTLPAAVSGLAAEARESVESVRSLLAPGTVPFVVDQLEPFDVVRQKALARKWAESISKKAADPLHRGSVEAGANSALRDYHAELVRHDLVLTSSDSELKQWAKRRASECESIVQSGDGIAVRTLRPRCGAGWGEWRDVVNKSPERPLRLCREVAARYGIRPPTKPPTENGAALFFARVQSWEWWLRRARRLQALAMESYARRRGFVHARGDVYVSNSSMRRRQYQLERNARALESRVAESTDGMECLLSDLAALGLANPENRFAEMVTRARGFEEVAWRRGHCTDFWTLTTPSRFHRMTKVALPDGGWKVEPNSAWEVQQLTVQDGQQWMCKRWSLIRAALLRRGIRCYGTRVAEPHHDGTVHWHMVLHFHPEQVAEAREVAFHYMFDDAGTEWGAQDHRFNIKAHNSAKGSAVGYLLKYIFKNLPGLDARGSEVDEVEGLLMEAGAHRVAAWAATWGIRQFQFIGGPSVTVWRELRRLMHANREPEQLDMFGGEKQLPEKLRELFDGMPEAARAALAADNKKWSDFVEAMGGPNLPRKYRPVKPGYWHRDVISPESGKAIPARTATRYGDETKGRLLGLLAVKFGEFGAFMERITTRVHDWFIRCVEVTKEQKKDDEKWRRSYAPPGFNVLAPQALP